MKVTIEGSAKKIAELVSLIQARQDFNGIKDVLLAGVQDALKAICDKNEE